MPRRRKSNVPSSSSALHPDTGDPAPSKVDNRLWATGRKLKFLESHIEGFKEADLLGQTSAFYSKVTAIWLCMWGWDLPMDNDAVPTVENPPEDAIRTVLNHDGLSTDEIQQRKKVYRELRERIQRWFRYHGKKSLKSQQVDHFAKLLADFAESTTKAPRRYTPFIGINGATTSSPIPDKLRLALSNQVAQRLYDAEGDDFKAHLLQEAEEDYQRRLAEHKASAASRSLPKTAEEFHNELQVAGHWLKPFLEHVSRRLGMNVSLFLAGPIGDSGGEVGVRSIHVGESNGLLQKLWPDFDSATHAVVTKSMIKFARTCFSADECRARALSPADSVLCEDGDSWGVGAAGNGESSTPPTLSASPSRAPTPTPSVQPSMTSTAAAVLVSAAVKAHAKQGKTLDTIATALHVATPRHSSTPPDVRHTPPSSPSFLSPLGHGRSTSMPPNPRLQALLSDLQHVVSSASQPGNVPATASTKENTASPPPPAPSSPESPVPAEPVSVPSAPRSGNKVAAKARSTMCDASEEGASAVGPTMLLHYSDPPALARSPLPNTVPLLHCGLPAVEVELNGCPATLREQVNFLLSDGGWGPRWQTFIATYVEIERSSDFTPRGRLLRPTDGRPAEVAAWMKYHRPLEDFLIGDISKFGASWWEWWYNNQPASRPTDRHGWYAMAEVFSAGWSELYVTGPNGLILFLLSAAWLGAAVQEADFVAQQDWLDAVEDMVFAFGQVLHTATLANLERVTTGSKRPNSAGDSHAAKKRKA
ncbi:hypothetical protein BN946_scf184348.g3 [Trametes cinnabarina]|uniref:Uncharacterized protein n=1 Tax=Pycnoporus cinnabarinus TaxID=5643 RepID=A0A060SPJ1_PYCCI|nr:hypothetical protein BN946_scf184348.g3 [Trametes cinnabarina]